MSTRSLIAIPIDDGNAAIGRYHHSDGYPTGLGVALFAARKAHKSFADMVKTLIFDHPAGWSSIVATDWLIEPGFTSFGSADDDTGECCDQPYWRHYRQYYARNSAAVPPVSDNPLAPAAVLGHAFARTPKLEDRRPSCYCHGERSESASPAAICVTEMDTDWCLGTDCDPLFLEWEYRLYPQGVEVWEARQPDDDSTYRHFRRGRVSWDHQSPRSAMAAIEEGQADLGMKWAGQMDALTQALKEAM